MAVPNTQTAGATANSYSDFTPEQLESLESSMLMLVEEPGKAEREKEFKKNMGVEGQY